jgi:hypothetical protein
MPLQATSGAASYDAFGGGVPVIRNYIEDVFSTYVYTGDAAARFIQNDIDIAGQGGLVWIKSRSAATGHRLVDTQRGIYNQIDCSSVAAQSANFSGLIGFSNNGFTLGSDSAYNGSSTTYVSWTFRKQPKFFDVVTYTGNGAASRSINHNLKTAPGVIIVTDLAGSSSRFVYHRSIAQPGYLALESTGSVVNASSVWTFSSPGADGFWVGSTLNANGKNYVAYLFAHDAGGFGLTGTDNVITCGTYTGNGSGTGPVVTLGYEPQWLMVKNASGTGDWNIIDSMRGMTVGGNDALLPANLSSSESADDYVIPTATGFRITSLSSQVNTSSATYIYIAIRRGPMKVPTDATKVFSPNVYSSISVPLTVTTNFPVDLAINTRTNGNSNRSVTDRLRGARTVFTNTSSAESPGSSFSFASNTALIDTAQYAGVNAVFWNFRRAPGFFDEVCYTGDGTFPRQVAHNLSVPPELTIIKRRNSGSTNWIVTYFNGTSITYSSAAWDFALNTGSIPGNTSTNSAWLPTTSYFVPLNSGAADNQAGDTYVAYLFATCPGVSKVGSYTGTGTLQTINCGFSAGVRFVLIKRTDAVDNWYVFDSAQGISSGIDPYMELNLGFGQSGGNNFIDTTSVGFQVTSAATASINASGGTYIFLAIA